MSRPLPLYATILWLAQNIQQQQQQQQQQQEKGVGELKKKKKKEVWNVSTSKYFKRGKGRKKRNDDITDVIFTIRCSKKTDRSSVVKK